MSSWGYFGGGGRWSPWGRAPPPATPDVRESDYAYISQDDIVDPPSSYRSPQDAYSGSRSRRQQHPDEDEEPDILVLKHKGNLYALEFAAYSISEGRLRVGEVRRAAAQKLGVRETRRVRLLYKSRQLKDDAAAAGEEGLKQNSELTCIVSETTDDLSSSGEESASEADLRRGRVDVYPSGRKENESTSRKPNRKKKGRKDKGTPVTSPPYEADEYFGSSSSKKNGRPAPTNDNSYADRSSSAHAAPTPAPPASSAFDSSLPVPKEEVLAFKQIAELEKKFRTELVGPAEEVLQNPPSDAKKRDYEFLRLIETMERDILLKTDAIDTEGRDDIRQKRKRLTNEVQSMLTKLDTAKKQWQGRK